MKKQCKSLLILASITAMVLTLPGAWAGAGRYDNSRHDNGYQKREQNHGHYNSHYPVHYNIHYRNDQRGGRYYHPPYQGYTSCGHHNQHNNNNKLWIGLRDGGLVAYPLGTVRPGY